MQRAAAKTKAVKLDKTGLRNLRNFKKDKVEEYRHRSVEKYSSNEKFGGARTSEEIAERNQLMASVEFNKLLAQNLDKEMLEQRV